MKKTVLLLAFSLIGSVMWAQSSIFVKGQDRVVDTLEHRQIGPGVVYTRATITSIPLTFYTLSVDMNNEYSRIETFQAQNTTGKTEAMTKAYTRLTTSTQKSLASINGNFWIVSGQGLDNLVGVPHSLSARNGQMVTADPNSWNKGHGNRGIAVIDETNKVLIDEMTFDGSVAIDGVGSFGISQINRDRDANQLVFFNDYTATTRTDDDGIEVFVKLANGQSWSVNRDVECEVVSIIKDKGANAIPAGQAVLSGEGTAKTFLENLAVGSKVKISQGVYTQTGNLRPYIAQMIAGNALVMKDGTLTDRNTNEAYNSQLYPRTGIGATADGKNVTLIVIDKKGTSIGASTETMCEILKAAGSIDATTLDGGGSAQMMLKGAIVNNPSDGNERAVANGWMLFSTAPQNDTEVASIKFLDYKVKVPKLASYKPTILAYDKYGNLINENLEGFTLSCDASLGSVTHNGSTFVATSGVGTLTASYNGLKATKEITVVDGEVMMQLDSLVIDNNFKYPIEVYSLVDGNPFYYDPASISWIIRNPAVCSIQDGVLSGLKNGETYIKGTLGSFSDSIKVKVQIPEAYSILFDDDYSQGWTLNSVSSATNKTLEKTATGVDYKFSYKSGRYPYVEMKKSTPLYALPDTLKLVLNTDIALSSAVVNFIASNAASISSLTTPALSVGTDYEIKVPFDQYIDTSVLGSYPIKLTSLYFNIASGVAAGDYTIKVKDFSLIYNYLKGSSSIDEEVADSEIIRIYPNPVTDGYLYLNLASYGNKSLEVNIYDISGKKVLHQVLQNAGDAYPLEVQNLNPGIYMLRINQNGTIKTAKFIIQ